jgi:hypothetical protein
VFAPPQLFQIVICFVVWDFVDVEVGVTRREATVADENFLFQQV